MSDNQLPLDDRTCTQCRFSKSGGKATGVYQIQTGFYGLTNMPAEFQKAIDLTLNNEKDTFPSLDDIRIISHGTKEHHIDKLKGVLDKLAAENIAILVEKCRFGCKELKWLGFVTKEYATKPIQKKTDAIANLPHPKTFKLLKIFLGSIHHLNKFISNLVKLCKPFWSLLSASNKFNFEWKAENENTFQT